MIRAGVFIGVDQTGGLQRLHDAVTGAQRMHKWALSQGMVDKSHAKLITDAEGKRVSPDHIYDAIKEILDGPGVDQLIIYFAGHGVNINRTEQWLLTEAPARTSAAVNVSGSVELARYSGIRHVVFISDACRVAPEGIQAQNVRGIDIFPSEGASDKAKPVDQYFACVLGKTAAELKDPGIAAGNFTALYTDAMLEALTGQHPDLLEPSDIAGDVSRYIRPSTLQSYLEREIPRRVKARLLEKKVNQNPDAIILAEIPPSPRRWIARIDTSDAAPGHALRGPHPPVTPGPDNRRSMTQMLVRTAAEGDIGAIGQQLQIAKARGELGAARLAGIAELVAAPFGPDHFETQCGIKVRGSRITDFFAPRAQAEIVGAGHELLRIIQLDQPAVSVLLQIEGAVGTVVPAIAGFLTALTFSDGELIDVAYEPSANTWRWDLYKERATSVRSLRAVAASASQHGRFRLEHEDAIKVAQQMQYAKGIDPTLAIYAAYAYHDLQAIERIHHMSGYLRDDVGVTFFDLELLSRKLIGRSIDQNDNVVPFFPLLSQGWALLGAHRVKLHPAIAGIESTMKESLWSLFDTVGIEKLKKAMQSMEVR